MNVQWLMRYWDRSVHLEITGLTKDEYEQIAMVFDAAAASHLHGTFKADGARVTDDEEGRTATRDGEQPFATLNLFKCK